MNRKHFYFWGLLGASAAAAVAVWLAKFPARDAASADRPASSLVPPRVEPARSEAGSSPHVSESTPVSNGDAARAPTEARETAPPPFLQRLRAHLDAGDLRGAKGLLADARDRTTLASDLQTVIAQSSRLRTRLMALRLLASLEGPGADEALIELARWGGLLRVRREAVLELGNRKGDRAAAALYDLLADAIPDLRLAAVQALGSQGSPEGVGRLAGLLTRDPSMAVRRAALQAIGRIGSPEAVGTLLASLESRDAPASPFLRGATLQALGGIAEPASLAALRDALGRASEPDLRRALLSSIARSADPSVLDLLLWAARGPDPQSRLAAIQGLARIGDARALPVLRDLEARGGELERLAIQAALLRIARLGR
jgi:hypothetical protein